MRLRIFAALFLALLLSTNANAKIEALTLRSNAMNKDIKVHIALPDDYDVSGAKKYPVIYMLHGYGGNSAGWMDLVKNINEVVTRDQIIIVSPSAENSWYWDSPIDPNSKYETFTSQELIKFIDDNYQTIKNRTGRAITGLSMGGHGAMFLAMTHKDTFGAAGSTSGGVDIRPFPNNWELYKLLGDINTPEGKKNWDEYTVMTKADNLKNGELAIIFDCGYDDFFFEVNNALHAKLLEKKIDHDYIVRPGEHNGDYWSNSIDYQILFFKKYFDKQNKAK